MATRTTTIPLLLLLAGIAPSLALAQPTEFHINNAAAYSRWKSAVRATEYVREDYLLGALPASCPTDGATTIEASTPGTKPRAIAVVAATMAFVERNPLAAANQITDFIAAFDAALRAAHPNDVHLRRRANFLQALRYTRLIATPASNSAPATLPSLLGTDTDIGQRALELLGVTIDPPLDYFGLQNRMTQFEHASNTSLALGVETGLLLTHAFMDQGPTGEPLLVSTLDDSISTYLRAEGYDPRLGTIRPELCGINTAIAQLPADYSAYLAAKAAGIDPASPTGSANPFQSQFAAAFDATITLTQEITDGLPATLERSLASSAIATASEIDSVRQQERARLRALSQSRAAMFANIVALAQDESENAAAFQYVKAQVQQSRAVQHLGRNAAMIERSFKLASAIGSFYYAGATSDYAGGFEAASSIVTSAFGIAGSSQTISNTQLSNQITRLSRQLGRVQDQLNDRLDRVDMRLNALLDVCVTGMTYLGDEVEQLSQQVFILQQDIDALTYSLDLIAFDIWVNTSQIRRLEDSLFGVAQDLLGQHFIAATFDVIGYRSVNIIDLPYGGPSPSFLTGANDIFQYASVDAKSASFGGSRTAPFALSQAAEELSQASIARHINELAVNAAAFGVAPLANQQVVAPEPWAQSVAAYIELARENPWYFAYLLANESTTPQITRMINDGQALVSVSIAARNPTLFNNLVADYKAKTRTLQQAVDAVIDDALATNTPLPLATTAASIRWADWQTAQVGAAGTASGVIDPSNRIDVSYRGDVAASTTTTSQATHYWTWNGPYATAALTNPPANDDMIALERANIVNTITFSRPTTNPVVAIFSLGRSSLQQTLTFSAPFALLNSGPGYFGSPSQLTARAGNNLDGREGNGLIQFSGTFTSISWTTNVPDSFYGVQVGVPGPTMLDLWMNTNDPASVQDIRPLAPPLGTQFLPQTGMPACCGPNPTLPIESSTAAYEGYWTLCRSDADIGGSGGGRQRAEQLRALLRRNAGVNVGTPTYNYVTNGDGYFIELLDRAGSQDSVVRRLGHEIFFDCSDGGCGSQDLSLGQGPLLLSYFWPQISSALTAGENLEGRRFDLSRPGFVPMHIEIWEDSVLPAPTQVVRTEINQRLFTLRDVLIRPAIESAMNSPTGPALKVAVYNALQALDDSAALLAAYANLALPYEVDVSDVLKSAFRGNPSRSELGLSAQAARALLTAFDAADSPSAPGNRAFDARAFAAVLNSRVDVVNAEVQRAITGQPLEASGYVEWMLTEARSLRDHASRLAIDDTFGPDASPVLRNVLDNDIRQQSTPGVDRPIEIDPTFGPGHSGYTAPTDGIVTLHSDGTFAFTPFDPSFQGSQIFTYRTRCNIAAAGAPSVWVLSAAASVRFEVAQRGCISDFNLDGGVDGADVTAFFTAWEAGADEADLNIDGGVDGGDIAPFFAAWEAGC